MTRIFFSWSLLAAFAVLAGAARAADPVDDGQARLREALRASMLQLRTAQADLAAAQAAQTAQTAENQALKTRAESERRQNGQDLAAAEKAIAGLKAAAAAQARELDQMRQAAQSWESSSRGAAAQATAKEGERARLAAALLEAERKIELRERQNRELYRLGNEILLRYEKFSLGEALAAREPFVGSTRTRLENQVQDYEDKLSAQAMRP